MAKYKEYNSLDIKGAGEHNLKNVDLVIPKNRFVVFTGVSGSGKSSLAFDTIYVEGQRKYIESLSSYARQFLGQMERPRYEKMTGLSPTVAIEQKTASSNPRSTVGTVTEILDYMRVLFARAGEQKCPGCLRPVGQQDPQQIVEALARQPEGTPVVILAPLVRQRKGEFKQLFEELLGQGFVRFRIDGETVRLEEPRSLDKKRKHDIDIAIDRFRIGGDKRARLHESVELALKAGKGRLIARISEEEVPFSEALYCDHCDISLPELSPQLFSFNNPLGACPVCHGLGVAFDMDFARVFKSDEVTLFKALRRVTFLWVGRRRGWEWDFWNSLERATGLNPEMEVGMLGEEDRRAVIYGPEKSADGETDFHGLWGYIEKDLKTTNSEAVRTQYYRFFTQQSCRACRGSRLRPAACAVFVGGRNIIDLTGATVAVARRFFAELKLDDHRGIIAAEPTREIVTRLQFLEDVGLEYLTLDRPAHTLSGGEAQRIRLARQLGSELSGVIYILDEPSVGLHQRDSLRLVKTLERLRDIGNSIIVVEHDRETIDHADFVVDFGPGAGRHGGEIVYSGDLRGLEACEASLTGAYLSGRERIEPPPERRKPSGWLSFEGISHNNLVNLDVEIPLGVFAVVTGVSGAGKSSLVAETVHPLLLRAVNGSSARFRGELVASHGLGQVDRVIAIDQKPIGRTPRSNPATYTKVFDQVRKLFAATREAKAYGYAAGRFSFNVKGGRCEKCQGDGSLKIEMHFLPDVYVRCPQCDGSRFNEATLRVKYKELSIADVLNLTIDEALEVFSAVPAARRILQTMSDVGLGYIKVGQPSTTLSGGEAQRIKLSRELARRELGHTFYLLDEPTTGLHFHDIRKLLGVVARLVESGHTVLMVEHNMDMIKCADQVIDLGPDGGDGGGKVVVAGTPEEVAACRGSRTGGFLRKVMDISGRKTR